MLREVVSASEVETAARFRTLPHGQRDASKLGQLVFDADIEVERRLVILELIIAAAAGEIAQHRVARGARFLALSQGQRSQFDSSCRSVELRDDDLLEQRGQGCLQGYLRAQVAAVKRITGGTVGGERRLAPLAEGE